MTNHNDGVQMLVLYYTQKIIVAVGGLAGHRMYGQPPDRASLKVRNGNVTAYLE